ncbi:hypothetical protein CAPTEDRAFT_176805 [Capitella teleta]|uniref:C2H2-type domain-containing protein n=1 Tax=Capitella teleta TaxID=283909 RepID=R7U5D5_CAPTE|nr:hypothetical protein CAPTEDRAFT_176805 [Capitella teleta]|eukprot:ELU01580.1 hypothetical protein CAPTEDRAFT_176805 [Capitella teleta]
MVHVPEPGVGPVLDLLYGTIVTIRDPDHFHDVKLAASLLGVLNLHNFLQTVEGDDVSRYPIRLQHHKVLSYGPSRRGWVPQKSISKACQTESAGAKASDLHIEEYVYHKKQDFNSEVKCPYCSIFFTNKVVYLSHLSRIHPTSKGEFWFTCDTCKEAFLSCSQYKQHLEIHPVNNVTVVSSVKKTAKTGSFLCQECGKICLSSYRLNQHMRIHAQKTAKQKVACPVCDLKFNNQADVEEHVVSQHSDPNDNICELCSKVFSTKRMLKSHKMFAHAVSALTMHYCQFCDEGFDETSALREHLKVHSTKRIKKEAAPPAPVLEEAPPIPMNNCQFCQKAFRKPFQLRNHEKKCRLKPVVTQEDVGEGNQRAIHIELPLNYMASDVPITIELPEGMELPPEIVLPSGENPETLHEVEEQMVNVQVKTE